MEKIMRKASKTADGRCKGIDGDVEGARGLNGLEKVSHVAPNRLNNLQE